MPFFFKYIGLCLLGFIITLNTLGQDKSGSANTCANLMNQYELICGRCIEMKQAVKSGSLVSKNEAERLLNEFINLNKKIKSIQDSLPLNQIIRFRRINKWFATGIRPTALDNKEDTPKVTYELSTAGESVLLQPIRHGYIIFNDSKNANETVRNKTKESRVFILANCSAPVSYGLRVGYMYGKWGGYIFGRSNFCKCDSHYICKSDGTMDNGLEFWSSNLARRSNSSACAGILFNTAKWLNIYIGAGYGQRSIFWEDIEGKWAKVTDLCHKGLAAETGIIASWKNLSICIGLSTVKFRTISADFGIGVNF